MKLTMLGTGSADGWPSPVCRCASCGPLRARGEMRRQTAALVDDAVLLDCGPEAPRSAVAAGLDLAAVTLLLFTHAHPDHCHPQLLLWRQWAGSTTPLVVAGPPDALDECRAWVGPDDPVTFVPLVAGDELDHPGYVVRALAANHTPGALLYDITDDGGARFLYATDTGPLPRSTHDALIDASLDAVFLELTWGDSHHDEALHHTLASFPLTVAALRRNGALRDGAAVVSIHMGHHNPPEPELSRRLAGFGAVAARDHQTFLIERGSTSSASVGDSAGALTNEAASWRPRRTLILGGARSGKSTEAERLVAADPAVRYIATSPMAIDDPEWQARVDEHRARRPGAWTTVETTDLAAELRVATSSTTLLIDCLTLWLSAMLDAHRAWDSSTGRDVVLGPRLDEVLAALRTTQARVVIVSNEVGSGIVPEHASGRLFRDALGSINRQVAQECEEVVLVTAGRATRL